jgi:hypothetical protein
MSQCYRRLYLDYSIAPVILNTFLSLSVVFDRYNVRLQLFRDYYIIEGFVRIKNFIAMKNLRLTQSLIKT